MYTNSKKITTGANILANEKSANIDYKYGPYSSKELAMEVLGEEGLDVLAIGLTVGIITDDGIEEYWFKKACNTIDDLIPKYQFTSSSDWNVPEENLPSETTAIDSNKEVQDFLEGIDNTKSLKQLLQNTSGTVDENGIVHFNI